MMDVIYKIMDTLLPFEIFRFTFMKNALLAILLLTPLLALLGTMAVNKRMAFFSDALGHSALFGLGLGVLLGISNVTVILVSFGILWAMLITRINRAGGASADTTISVFSSTGIALGLLILSGNGRFSKYSAILVGDVLAVTQGDILWLALSLVIGVILWAVLYNKLLLTAVNPQLAQSRGIRTNPVEYAFVILVAVAVMLSIRWVGVLLINALLILPAAAARNIARNARQHAVYSVLFSVFSGVCGLCISVPLSSSVGAAVVLCAACIYAVTLLLSRILRIRLQA
ncbi:MAG: metal ABC transporter permease [Clostridia bacterium]|nr:metal ABC transporter permease [Clostridia bacterium]